MQELSLWWFQKCVTMGKNRAKDNESSGDVSPPKLTKVGESSSAGVGTAASTSAVQPANDMLVALNSISLILKDGFDSLKTKVGEVSTNINNLDEKMDKKLDALADMPADDSEDEAEHDGGAVDNPRQGDHELSEGEIVENKSSVLTSTLKELESDESIGSPVKENVADFVKKAFEKPVKGDNAKKFKDRLSIPSNVDCLIVPRVNEPIFVKLSTTAKNKDRAIQDSQVTFMKVATALVRITDVLADHEEEGQWVKDAMQMAADAITLTAALQEGWMKARREDIKPSLPDDFKRLASVEVPLTSKYLFGEDLEGSIKSVENTNKLAKKMDGGKKPKPPQNNNNNKFNKSSYKKKKKFNNNNNSGSNGEKSNKKDFQKRGSKN